jgi:DNA-3-methyladenine glycosylase II
MTAAFTITPRGPFSLAQARDFIGSFRPAGQPTDGDGFDLVVEGAVVRLREDAGGVHASVVAGTGRDDLEAQVTRILSLDHDATGWAELGQRDRILGEVQRARPGLRPVLFATPWEAAVWSILTQRTQHRQALRLREELVAAAGTPLSLDGTTVRPFPAPEAVLELGELPLPSVKAQRVRGVAQAALDGELDADRLRGMGPQDAMAAVRELPGIGPFSSALIVIRGAGVADAPATFEPRVRALTAERYDDPALEEPDAFAAFAERWRPWRSWAAFALRAA